MSQHAPIPRRTFLASSILAAAAGTAYGQGEKEGKKPRIKAGQIGVRHAHAGGKWDAMRRLVDDYELVGLAEASESAKAGAQKGKTYAGAVWMDEAELLGNKDVQVVAVETTLEESTPTALRAVEAGKHIHLDKPGGADHAAFRRMRLLAEQKGLTVQMGYMLRHNPAFELLFQAHRDGWFGDVFEVNASMGKLAGDGLRKQLADLPGHGMFELGCHLVDAVVTLLGPPSSIVPFAGATRGPSDPLPDNQVAVFTYPKAVAVIRCSHADPDGGPRRMFEVAGTQGGMTISPLESGRLELRLTKPCGDFSQGRHPLQLQLPQGRYDGEFQTLARAVRGETPLPWTASHDVAVHAAALQAAGLKAE